MIEFFVAATGVVVLALGVLLWPILVKKTTVSFSRREMNAAIYRDQLARLDLDRAENMLAKQDYLQARAELQRRVIEDAGEEGAHAAIAAPKKTAIGLALFVPLVAIGMYVLLGNPGAIGYVEPSQQATAPDVNRMLEALALKLQQEPDNPQGWEILARSYKVLGRTAEAEQAFERAATYIDGNAQLLAIYADLVATNANGDFTGKPMSLISKALALDANNPLALWLAGSAAFQSRDFATAMKKWEQLLLQLPKGSEEVNALQASIQEASKRMGSKESPATDAAVLTEKKLAHDGKKPGANAASVGGVVQLDVALRSRVSPDDVLMVIARAPGERMPRAVLRVRAAELPLAFSLDDSLSMSPQARMSSATEVTVEARISKSGMAMPESGDLISGMQTVKVGTTGLRLLVNQVRP